MADMDLDADRQDLAADYEALVEFLYLAPVGIIKFRPDGTIDMANPTAAQLLMPLALDGDMSDLYRLLAGLAPDLARHVENFPEPGGQVFDQLPLVVPETGSTLMLDINKINANTMMAVIQNVTDLTEARREVLRRTESQRLLASVFMRLNTPVVVVRADGFILLTNPAFQTLLGYASKSLAGLNIDALLPADESGAARAARAQQMVDGVNYQVQTRITAKDGTRLNVTLISSILREKDNKQLQVITLMPDSAEHRAQGAPKQVRTIDMSTIRNAVGLDWPFIGDRGMALAEARIKPLLGQADILRRGKDDSFIIWFADQDARRCNAILDKAAHAVRQLFTTEFGSKIASRVVAATAQA